jgi:hypothetical protein
LKCVLDISARFPIKSALFSGMRIVSKVLWTLAFLTATFIWMVLFEQGFSVKGLTEGTQTELKTISAWFSGKK